MNFPTLFQKFYYVAVYENGNGSHQLYGLSEYDILNALKFAGIIDFDISDERQVHVSFSQDAM